MIRQATQRAAGCESTPPSRVVAVLVAVVLALPALLLMGSPEATGLLEYDRQAIATGEIWRLVTSHWTHWSADHLALDLAAFALLALLCWRFDPWRLATTLGLAAPLIPLVLWIAHPEMARYRGLSGIDSALFALLAVLLLRKVIHERRVVLGWVVGLAVVAFAAKIGIEAATGAAVFVSSEGFVPMPLAHAVGAACGTAVAAPPGRLR